MYFFVMLDNIKSIFGVIMGISMTVVVIILIMAFLSALYIFIDYSLHDWDCFTKFFTHKITIIIFSITFCLSWIGFITKTMIPSTKQAAIIYIVPKVINNEHAKEIPENLIKFVNKYLEENIGDEFDKLKNKIQDPNIIETFKTE